MALDYGGVGGEEVEVATALDVGDPGSRGMGDSDVKRVVIARAVSILKRRE